MASSIILQVVISFLIVRLDNKTAHDKKVKIKKNKTQLTFKNLVI